MSYKELIVRGSREFYVNPNLVVGPTKPRMIQPCRYAIYMAFHLRGNSMMQIGRWMNKDHSSVHYGLKKAKKWMEEDVEYANKVRRLAQFGRDQSGVPAQVTDSSSAINTSLNSEAIRL